ncbi:phage tail sheath family protein [Enterobacteriaceae bacterium LUAb1]
MSTEVFTPGVYIQEDAAPAVSVSPGATAVPLFVGRFMPRDENKTTGITRISSWLDYATLFESTTAATATVELNRQGYSASASEKKRSKETSGEGEHTAGYNIAKFDVTAPGSSVALQLYFQNGGGACYLYPYSAKKSADQTDKKGHDQETAGEQTEEDEPKNAASLHNMPLLSDANPLDLLPSLIEEAGDITLIACTEPDQEYRQAVYSALTGLLDQNKGYFLLADSAEGQRPPGFSDSAHIAVYYPCIVVPQAMEDDNVTLSGYVHTDGKTVSTLTALRNIDPPLAALIDAKIKTQSLSQLLIPPSAVMAGVYCKTDRERGVWKAPANVVLNGVSKLSAQVTDDRQGQMNQAGINVIRHFNDRGFVVWGARTLKDDDNWRYIPVRRLFDAAQRDIKKAMRPMVFEPNSQPTWKRVQAAIENYLYSLWQQGGLAGNKAAEAYSVHIGKDITMTQEEINQGKMIVRVAMAAVRPAEFIILQFTQDMSQ